MRRQCSQAFQDWRGGKVAYLFSGVAPNRKSHPLVCVWGAALFVHGNFEDCVPLEDLLERTGLNRRPVPNRDVDIDLNDSKELLPEAVTWAGIWVRERCEVFNRETEPKLGEALQELEKLKKRQLRHLENVFLESPPSRSNQGCSVRKEEARY